ncbi:MAG: hypothetical protein ACK4N5_00115 [Myxococcales bacterium]
MKRAQAEQGESSWSGVVWLGGIAAVVYFAMMYVPPYMESMEVKSVLREASTKAYHEQNDDVLREFIGSRLKQIGSHQELRDGQETSVPGLGVNDSDIVVNREPGKSIVVRVRYAKAINYPFTKKQKVMYFSPAVKGDLTPVKW